MLNPITRRRIPTRVGLLAALALLLAPPSFASPLYPEPASAQADLDAALKQAADAHKRVLVEFGANWCTDCRVLEENFHRPENAALLSSHFVLVHINVGNHGIDRNKELAQRFGIPLANGIPALAVLESDGRVVFSQKNGEFEAMSRMDPRSVNEFLARWKSD